MTFLEELAESCRRRSRHPAIRHEGRLVTCGELDEATNRLAHALRAAGIRRGDRVTLALASSVEWLLSAYDALRAESGDAGKPRLG